MACLPWPPGASAPTSYEYAPDEKLDDEKLLQTFYGQDRVVWERDLGVLTDAEARGIVMYNPDSTWAATQ